MRGTFHFIDGTFVELGFELEDFTNSFAEALLVTFDEFC